MEDPDGEERLVTTSEVAELMLAKKPANLPVPLAEPPDEPETVVIKERADLFRSMLRYAFVLALVFTVVVAAIVGYAAINIWPHVKNPLPAQTIDRSQPPLLKSIQDLSRYVAAEGNFQEVIDLQHNRKWVPDFLVNDRTLFVAVATMEVYVDFGSITDGAITASPDRTSVQIKLPAPAMGKPNIDHGKSYVVAEQKGALNRIGDFFGGDPNREQEVYLHAEQRIAAAARDSGLADRAQVNTRKMLEGMLHGLGYTTVNITFAAP